MKPNSASELMPPFFFRHPRCSTSLANYVKRNYSNSSFQAIPNFFKPQLGWTNPMIVHLEKFFLGSKIQIRREPVYASNQISKNNEVEIL